MKICPSVLESKAEDYLKTIKKLSPYYNYFQIDVADGVYVKNKTASVDEIINSFTNPQPETSNQLTSQTSISKLQFDFHLMVKNYQEEIEKIKKAKRLINIKNIFVHFDLFPNYQLLTTHSPLFNIGLVLNPKDQISDLANHYNLNSIDCLMIMSVIPGAQGNPFIKETLNKIEQLRNLDYRNKIFLDGGINDKTLPIIKSKKYQPDVICPGSFLTKSDDLKKSTLLLQDCLVLRQSCNN